MGPYTHWSIGCETGDAPAILRLSLQVTDGGHTDIPRLVSGLRRCTSLQHLSIGACIGDVGQLEPLLDSLLCATSLASLHLKVSSDVRGAGPVRMESLSRLLDARGSLEFLGVQFDPCWQDLAVQAVCSAMSRGLVLRGLCVGPHVGLHGLRALSEAIGCSTHLQHLHVQSSRAGIAGEVLMQGVLRNCSLKDLSFSENLFQSDDSIELLARVLRTHPGLVGLYMDCDGMIAPNARTLADALQASRLERFFVTRDNTSYVSSILLDGLKRSRTVAEIGGILHRVGRQALQDFIRGNRSVQRVHVRGGFMNKFGWPDVVVAYRESPRVRPLQALTGNAPFHHGRIFWWCDRHRHWTLASSHGGRMEAPCRDVGYRWCSKAKAWSVSHLPPFARPVHREDEVSPPPPPPLDPLRARRSLPP